MVIVSRYLPSRFKRSVIAPRFLEQLRKCQTVVGGPFKGMRHHGEAVSSVAAPKIMGVYECELVPWFRKWSAVPFQQIINVGAAEGYYAVGCALMWPQATVTAFESSEEGQILLIRNVELNALESRVKIKGHCGLQQLDAATRNNEPTLVIMDVDGEEGHLLNPAAVPGLANAHIIVEIHDFIDERLGEIVSSALKSTHVIEEVHAESRALQDFHEPRALWRRCWLLPYLKQYANELRPGPTRWFCCTPITSKQGLGDQRRTSNRTQSTLSAQRNALARKFALGLLRLFSGMNVSVRLGEIAHNALARWPVPPQPPKQVADFSYVTMCDRAHWLMLRESLFSLYRSWNSLPKITVVSDGSWAADEFADVFAWWPTPITVLMREEICRSALSAGFPELADYARESIWGLELATVTTQAKQRPVLYADADILWFRDPALLLGDPVSWNKPRALRESNCHQRRDMALRHCARVLEPPFVNGGMVALHGELMKPALLRSMVQDAMRNPQDSSCEQTIIATAVKLGGELLQEKLSLVEFDDVHRFCPRNMKNEGYYSRHYVNWVRHLLYRDALGVRLKHIQCHNKG